MMTSFLSWLGNLSTPPATVNAGLGPDSGTTALWIIGAIFVVLVVLLLVAR